MTFTPYYRCTVDMITDVKFKKLYLKYGKDVFAMYWMWHMILTEATKSKSGSFNQGDGVAHDDLSLMSVFDYVAVTYGLDFIKMVLAEFSGNDYRLISVDDDGLMEVRNWEKYQHHTISSGRVEKHREGLKNEPLVTEIMNMFNEITRKNCRVSTDAYRKLIRGRLSEGHSKEDFEKVIRWKHNQWSNDPKMAIFIRPDTLFRPSHFDTYLNEIPKNGMNRVLTENDITTPSADATDNNAVEAVFKVVDMYGRERIVTQAQFNKAEKGYFRKI